MIGANANTQLTISDALIEQFNKTRTDNKTNTTVLSAPTINWDDKYGTENWTETYTTALSITGSSEGLADTLKYTETKTAESPHIWNPESDNMALINQYDGVGKENRTFNFDSKNDVYTVKDNVGTTTAGTLTIQGVSDGEKRSTVDFDGHDGFNLSNDNTTLTLKDVDIKNSNYLAKSTNESSVINIDGAKLSDNGDGIRTSGTVNITGKSVLEDKILMTSANAKANVENSDDATINPRIYGIGELNVDNATLNLGSNAKILGIDAVVNNSTIKLSDEGSLAGVRVNSDPLHTIQLNPSLKVIGNLNHGWQPYASVEMVWNLMGETKAAANGVKLPEMSVKPYVEYGVGVQKQMGDRFTGYTQAMLRNGGRNSIALTGGFRWALGKDSSTPKEKGMNEQKPCVSCGTQIIEPTIQLTDSNKKVLKKKVKTIQGAKVLKQLTPEQKARIQARAKNNNNNKIN